jgi:hypothetical protein
MDIDTAIDLGQLVPADLPHGREAVEAGRALARGVERVSASVRCTARTRASPPNASGASAPASRASRARR